jgi:hypothetical protein
VPSLPDDLQTDFVAARDVMSLGFTEAGLIYAGRGLEGVVRRIANDHNLFPGKPIERVRFAEILTALEAKRFSNDRKLVIDEQTKHRLHLSRAMRNHSAHPDSQRAFTRLSRRSHFDGTKGKRALEKVFKGGRQNCIDSKRMNSNGRVAIGNAQRTRLLQEVSGICPFCGLELIGSLQIHHIDRVSSNTVDEIFWPCVRHATNS